MTTLGYVHHSGRFDRSPEQLGRSLVEQTFFADVSVIGVTEVANPNRASKAAELLARAGWGWAHLPHGECAVAYDATKFAVSLSHVVEVQVSAVKTWSTKGRSRTPFTVLFVLLRSLSDGKTYLVSVGHTPSHVEGPGGWRNNNRARQHRDGLKGWRMAQRRLRKQWRPTGGVALSMDLNLNAAHRWVRLYLRSSFPGLRLVRDRGFVGTHGNRAIDIVLVSRSLRPLAWFKGRRIRVVRAKDSDHRSIITRLRRR